MSKFVKAAIIRAIRTFAQSMLSMITVGAALSDINWIMALSISAVATVYSLLTSIATGLPEVEKKPTEMSAGDLYIYNDEDGTQFLVDLNQVPDEIANSDRAVFEVKNVKPKE